MEPWMWITLWSVLIGVVTALYVRERRSGRAIDYDTYASKGSADDQARMNREINGPNSAGMQGG